MSETDEYRHYAEEAMRWITDCTDPKEKLVLISLACTWLQAAGCSDSRLRVALPTAWLADVVEQLLSAKGRRRNTFCAGKKMTAGSVAPSREVDTRSLSRSQSSKSRGQPRSAPV
jgi:hypothetical protein